MDRTEKFALIALLLSSIAAGCDGCDTSHPSPPATPDETFCNISYGECNYYQCGDNTTTCIMNCQGNGGVLIKTTSEAQAGNYCSTCCNTSTVQCAKGPTGAYSTTPVTQTAQATCFCQSADNTCNGKNDAGNTVGQLFPTGALACAQLCTNGFLSSTSVPDTSTCKATPFSTTQPDWISPGTSGNMCTTDQPLPRVYHVLPTALRAQVTGTLTASIDGETPKGDVQAGMLDFGSNDPYCRSGAPCAPGALNSFFVSTTFDNLVVKGKPVQSVTISIPAPVGVEAIITLDGSNFQYTLPVGAIFGGYAKVDNTDQWLSLTSFQPVTGTYNVDEGVFTAQLYLTGTLAGVTATLTGTVTTGTVLDRAPRLGTPTFANTVTTGSTCASQVSFTIPATDLDGDSLTFYVAEVSGNVLYSGGATAGGTAAFSANMSVGKHQIFVQVDDGKGGYDNLYQTLVVTDGTPPQFARTPPDVKTTACGGQVNLGAATAVDNCSSGTPVAITNNAPGTFPLGTTTVTWTATDTSGNTATYKQRVTVAGQPKFVLTPSNISYTACDPAPTSIGTATAVDICGSALKVTNNAASTFPVGTTTVTWTATDSMGDSATYKQKVTVSAATDLGVEHNMSTVKNNACLEVTKYPNWGQYMHTIIIQPQADGVGWPISFTYANCTSNHGSGSLPGPWQQGSTSPVSAGCPTLVKLGGNGAGSISLRWWGNG
jgi:hypothetical protein